MTVSDDLRPVATLEGAPTPTIRDVARAAGVSVGTASKALNGRGSLRLKTRERVQAAAASLHFRPNVLAQSLSIGRSYTVGLLTNGVYNGRFSIPLLNGIEDALGSADLSVFLCNGREESAREQAHIRSLLAKQVDGIIVTGSRTDPRPPIDVGNSSVPVIYAYTQVTGSGTLSIIPDDVLGGRLATGHLLQQGRRHLAVITGPASYLAVHQRIQGFHLEHAERGLETPRDRILLEPSSPDGRDWRESWGYQAVGMLAGQLRRIDGIFCGSDPLARGVLDALRDRGIRVPDDIAIVGYDNWDLYCLDARPPLTTVEVNLHALGVQAATRLMAAINGERLEGMIRQPCTLVVRESTGVGQSLPRTDPGDEGASSPAPRAKDHEIPDMNARQSTYGAAERSNVSHNVRFGRNGGTSIAVHPHAHRDHSRSSMALPDPAQQRIQAMGCSVVALADRATLPCDFGERR